ncbi:MAG: hypothetical protein HY591_02290 [Candidatus Omnitrophica bacterium]|nr:hypothetical protein [Candidatus Omnitrophota bacterium]
MARVLLGKAFRDCGTAVKKNKLPFERFQSKLTYFDHYWFRIRLRRMDTQLRKIYAPFCMPPDFKKKYLYFAAAQQPEATTDIHGGVYRDHILVLEILSASVPEDWIIYYKEHPANFYPLVKSSLRRNRHFYDRIKNLKNVQMVLPETDPFCLIDHSQAVASIAGTTSWEAAGRGKPALFFGNVWYQGCKGLFKIDTLQDCREAVRKIINGHVPDQKEIERYIIAIEKVAMKDLDFRKFAKQVISEDELERIAKELYEAYVRYYAV